MYNQIQYKTINGFENYIISNYGKVYHNNKEITPCDNGSGYLFVRLSKNGKRYNRYVHRLVYENFIGKINNEINHKDHNKYNNYILNLEDVSHKRNMICAKEQYGEYYLPSMNQARKGTIYQYDINNNLINSFDSVKSAAQWILSNVKNLKTSNLKSITDTLNKHFSGKRKNNFTYGYFWEIK